MRRPRRAILALALLVGAGRAAVAQRPEPVTWPSAVRVGFQPTAARRIGVQSLALTDTAAIRPTHWFEGGLIGGAVVGLLGAAVAYMICTDGESVHSECVLPATAAVAVSFGLGFTVGALVGGQFPKHGP